MFYVGLFSAKATELPLDLGRGLCSLLIAAAAGWFAWTLWHLVVSPRREDLNFFERERRVRLRSTSMFFRWCEPLVDELEAIYNAFSGTATRVQLQWDLGLFPGQTPWRAGEWFAVTLLQGALMAGAPAIVLSFVAGPVMGLFLFLFIVAIYQWLSRSAVHDKGRRRLEEIRMRLPYVIDLMSLTMEAGASFVESLETAVRENRDHPLGEEFGQVLREIELGRTRREALESLRDRLHESSVSDFVFSVVKGEELGTPLAEILTRQADQLRMQRSQWAEKAIAKAQVAITLPGMGVMVACLIVIVAPFVLRALRSL